MKMAGLDMGSEAFRPHSHVVSGKKSGVTQAACIGNVRRLKVDLVKRLRLIMLEAQRLQEYGWPPIFATT